MKNKLFLAFIFLFFMLTNVFAMPLSNQLAVNQPIKGTDAAGTQEMTIIDENGNLKVVDNPAVNKPQKTVQPNVPTPTQPEPSTVLPAPMKPIKSIK